MDEKLLKDLACPVQWHFDESKANRPIEFIEKFCKQSQGKIGEPIKLELFQKAMLQAAYGFVDDLDIRKYIEVLDIVGRKNGKTTILSGIEWYMLLGDGEGAPEELYKSNENLVYFVLRKEFPQFLYDDDMKQVARMALWKSCQDFDPARGFKISSIATCYIQNAIGQVIRSQNRSCRKSQTGEIFLDEQFNNDGRVTTFGEIIPDTRVELEFENAEFDWRRLSSLFNNREQEAVRLSYIGMSQSQIAQRMGISQSLVSRILASARKKIIRGGIM